jgi:multidrug efflux pump subunit AcrA (membrane-fusion protein)
MSDDTGAKTPEELAAELKKLTAQLEAARTEAEKAKADAEAERKRFEDAKLSRDKAKEKEREEASKRGEFEKEKKLLEEQITELRAQHDEAIKAMVSRDSFVELENRVRDTLLARLPEELREGYRDVPITYLEKFASDYPVSEHKPPTSGAGGKPPLVGERKWSELTDNERLELAAAKTAQELAVMFQSEKAKP